MPTSGNGPFEGLELKVGGLAYRVRSDDETTRGLSERDRLGETDHSDLFISLNNHYPKTSLETLTHEVLHTLLHFTGLDGELKDSERVVSRLSKALHMFLTENPDFRTLFL